MSYERVLVAVDVVSDAAATVLRRARQVCPDAERTAVHVVEEGHLPLADEVAFRSLADFRRQVEAALRVRLDDLCSGPDVDQGLLLEGRAASEIRRYAEREGADLTVIGSHGRHGWQLLLGSTANGVLHGSVCDVLCVHVPEDDVQPYREVLAAVDLTAESRTVVERAVAVAAVSGARVSLVSVVQPLAYPYAGVDIAAPYSLGITRDAEAQAVTHLNALAERFGVAGAAMVRRGHPAAEIHAATEELSADLVVVGTHARHGLELVLGSTANGVLHGAKSDVLAVRVGG